MNVDEEDIDPFSMFGSETDDVDTDQGEIIAKIRDPSNGMLAFHDGTEQALLLYVQEQLSELNMISKQQQNDETSREKVSRIVTLIDNFCYQRHWMMHVGPEKAGVLQEFLLESYKQTVDNVKDPASTFVIVEIGTYCGYSLLRMAQIILNTQKHDEIHNFHIVTVDVNARNQNVAKEMVAMAGLSDHVTFILLESLSSVNNVNSELSEKVIHVVTNKLNRDRVDFVFIDHDKKKYLSDLHQLENTKLIKSGTYVAADNVYIFQINDYRQYMSSLADADIVTTQLRTGFLEYILPKDENQNEIFPNDDILESPSNLLDETFRDGIGK